MKLIVSPKFHKSLGRRMPYWRRNNWSLTSVGVWTLANLVANRAYYEALKPVSLFDLPPTRAAKRVMRRMNRIKKQYLKVHKKLEKFPFKGNQIDLTNLLLDLAYCRWFDQHIKADIEREIEQTCEPFRRIPVQMELTEMGKWFAEMEKILLGALRELGKAIDDNPEYWTHVNRVMSEVKIDFQSGKLRFDGAGLNLTLTSPPGP